jgi:hypothetical protein
MFGSKNCHLFAFGPLQLEPSYISMQNLNILSHTATLDENIVTGISLLCRCLVVMYNLETLKQADPPAKEYMHYETEEKWVQGPTMVYRATDKRMTWIKARNMYYFIFQVLCRSKRFSE